MVEPANVLGCGVLKVVDVPGPACANEFGLEQRVEGLGEGLVVEVSGRADRGDRASLRETLGVTDRDALDVLSLRCVNPATSWTVCRRVQMPIFPVRPVRGRPAASSTAASRPRVGRTRR